MDPIQQSIQAIVESMAQRQGQSAPEQDPVAKLKALGMDPQGYLASHQYTSRRHGTPTNTETRRFNQQMDPNEVTGRTEPMYPKQRKQRYAADVSGPTNMKGKPYSETTVGEPEYLKPNVRDMDPVTDMFESLLSQAGPDEARQLIISNGAEMLLDLFEQYVAKQGGASNGQQ